MSSPIPNRLATEIVKTPIGSFMILSGDLLGGHIKRGDPWEPHFTRIVQNTVPQGAQVLDIGANFGLNTLVLANAVGSSGVVVAVEPVRIIFQQLCGNCFLNGLVNVLTLNAAVGASPGVAEMNPVNYFATNWNFGDNQLGSGGERVQMITIDGARQTLFTARPVIFIEIEEAQLQQRGTNGQAVIDLLKSLGYILIHIRNDYPVDYLCLPIERKAEIANYQSLIEHPTTVLE